MKKALSTLAVLSLLVSSAFSLGACSKDPPPKPNDGPKPSTPVPSDMVFNDFVPPSGNAGVVGVKVDGSALEGGADLGTAAAGGGAAPGAPEGEAEAANRFKVIEPGAEPRAVRRYAFAANKTEKRLVVSKQSASAEGGGPAQAAVFNITVDITPKQAKPTGTHFELKVLNVDIPDVPAAQKAMAAQQLAVFKGLTAQFEMSKTGEVGELDFKADEKMQNQAAETILQAVQQSVELLVPPMPDAPIGVGAVWERKTEAKERGILRKQRHTFTLKELNADTGTGLVTAETETEIPKTAVNQRGAPPGMTIEVKEKGTYSYSFKLTGIATKVDSDRTVTQKQDVPNAPPGKGSQAVVIKMKSSLEVPK